MKQMERNRDRTMDMLGMESQPIFVVGVPRSGTTLLQAILSRSRRMYSMPETHFFESVLPEMGMGPRDLLAEDDVRAALSSLDAMMALRMGGDERNELMALGMQGQLGGQELFNRVMECYRPEHDVGKTLRAVEKTPGHVQHLDEILEVYPAAKFVHIVREPKNAISSVLSTPFVKTQWLVWHCARWLATTGYSKRFGRDHPEAIVTVRYEDLLSQPEECVRDICQFIGVEFEASMLQAQETHARPPVVLEQETWKAGALETIRANKPDAWRKRIEPEAGWFIDWVTRSTQADCDYAAGTMIASRAKGRTLARQWTFLRRRPEDRSVSIWLLRRCLALGEVNPARQLASGLIVADCRMMSEWSVRAALRGKVAYQSRV